MNKTERISSKDYQGLVSKKTSKTKTSSKEQKISAVVLKGLIEKKFGATVELEYRFHPKRQWRIDVCVWGSKDPVAIEFEGGIWSGGRHTNGSGFIKDIDKYNTLSIYGYRLMRYTHTNHQYADILNDLKLLL